MMTCNSISFNILTHTHILDCILGGGGKTSANLYLFDVEVGSALIVAQVLVFAAPVPVELVDPALSVAAALVLVESAVSVAAAPVELVGPVVSVAAAPVELVGPVVSVAAAPVELVGPVVSVAAAPVELVGPVVSVAALVGHAVFVVLHHMVVVVCVDFVGVLVRALFVVSHHPLIYIECTCNNLSK